MIGINEVVRFAAGLAAVATFYVAWFVYEDEERRLQNKLETWWLQFDDIHSKMVSRQAAFVVIVAQRANDILDRMFGQALFAKGSIAAAVCLTVGGYYFCPQVVFALFHVKVAWHFMAIGFLILACAAAPLVSPRLRRLPQIIMWMFIVYLVFTTVLLILNLLFIKPAEALTVLNFVPATLLLDVILLGGVALVLFELAVARKAMRWTIVARSEWPILLGMALISAPIGILLAVLVTILFPILTTRTPSTIAALTTVTPKNVLMWGTLVIMLACLVSTALWGLLAIIASMMLLHRVVWPLTSRVLYALARYRLVQNKLALNAAGVALAGVAITGAYGWQTILRYFGIT